MSNFEGARGSGDINFLFDQDGRVAVIFGMVDPAEGERGGPYELSWNPNFTPPACSDLPGSRLAKCNEE